jgi:hypothetical protein
MKSSDAMKTLLKADEQTVLKEKLVISGLQVTKKEFESKRNDSGSRS